MCYFVCSWIVRLILTCAILLVSSSPYNGRQFQAFWRWRHQNGVQRYATGYSIWDSCTIGAMHCFVKLQFSSCHVQPFFYLLPSPMKAKCKFLMHLVLPNQCSWWNVCKLAIHCIHLSIKQTHIFLCFISKEKEVVMAKVEPSFNLRILFGWLALYTSH